MCGSKRSLRLRDALSATDEKKGGLSLQRLLPGQTETLLQRCLVDNIGPTCLSDTFTRDPASGFEIAPVSDQALYRRLSKRLIGYECLLGNDAFADTGGADILVGLAAGQVPSRGETVANTFTASL